jgi:cytochrome P450/nitrite reductase/ring-hydroxylating ferredoxin subunit
VAVARATDILPARPYAAAAGTLDLVLVRIGEAIFAYEGVCPHQGALLGEGELEGHTLICRNHRWRFDATTGQREGGAQCLRSYPIKVEQDRVLVAVDNRASAAAGNGTARRKFSDLSGPRPLPIVGNLLDLRSGGRHDIFEHWCARYGPVFRVQLGKHPAIVIADPELVAHVLRARPEGFRRFSSLAALLNESGVADGVFTAEGASWRSQRILAMDALSHRRLKSFYPTLKRVAERLVRRWRTSAAAGDVVDIQKDLMRFTVDVTTTLAFGRDMNTIEGGDDVIQRHLEVLFPMVERRLSIPFAYWRYLRLPADRRFDRALVAVHAWLGGVMAETRRALLQMPGREPENFLEAMLLARDARGQPFSDDTILGNAMTMLLAGEDTTANTLAWAVHELCDNDQAIASLRAETDRLLAPQTIPETAASAHDLVYAGAIANETLRLRPVAPLLYLESNQKTTLGDLEIETGQGVILLMRPASVDPNRYDRPSEFRPERWHGDKADPSFMPFGSGPRICPGRSLALLEMKVVLGALYHNFSVSRVGKRDDVIEVSKFTMQPEGLRVRLSPRT